jgi:hypothetical protein
MGKVLASAGAAADDGPGVPLAVLEWGATAAGYLAAAASDEMDELIVTSRRAYHLVRKLDGGAGRPLLVYLRLDRARANLAVARRALAALRVTRAPTPRRHGVATKQEIPAQSGSVETTAGADQGPAVAVAAPVAPRSALPWSTLPRRHQVAALPLPRRSAAVSLPAPPPAAPDPLPRRFAEVPPPVASAVSGADPPSVPAPRWVNDVGTMRRLLAGLEQLQ